MSFMVNPHRFGGAGSSAAPVAVTQFNLNTVTGNQTVSVSGFGTPVAAIFIASANQTSGNSAGAVMSFGATDGTNQWVTAAKSAHGVTPTSAACGRRAATDECIMIMNGSNSNNNVVVEANLVSFGSDEFTINIGATGGAGTDYLVTAILFGGTAGSGWSAKAGTTTLATQNNVKTITPGFQTNALIVDHALGLAFTDVGTAVSGFDQGWASYDGTTIRQCAAQYRSDGANPTTVQGLVRNDAVWAITGASRRAVLQNITSTAFDLLSQGADLSGLTVGYLALNFGGSHEAWAGVVDSPTSTGSANLPASGGPSFTPSFAMMRPNMLSAVNTDETAGQAGGFGLAAMTADAQYCTAWADEDNQTTTDTQSVAGAAAINLDDHTGADQFDATLTGFATGAATLNFTAANGTARKWPALLIG